ncbi:MAG: phosphoribosylglycinamide formyltransferase [Actinomycetota bacterium]
MRGRIVVLISGSGSNMEALAEACERGEVPGEMAAVVADRACIGLKLAEKRELQTFLLEPRDFESRGEWCEALREVVEAQRPDLVVSAGFMRILAPVFVDAYAGRLINLHPSLLPAFKGAHAVRDALEAGVKVTGSTVHFVDNEVDHGSIVMQKPVPVREGDTEEVLHERIKALEHRLLPEVCRLFLEGRVQLEGGRVRILGR